MKQINFSCILQSIKINKYGTIAIELKQHLYSFSTFRQLLLSPQLDTSQMNFGKLEKNLRVSYYYRRGNLPLCYVSANDQFFPIDLVLNLGVSVNEEYAENSQLSPEARWQSGHLLLSLQWCHGGIAWI